MNQSTKLNSGICPQQKDLPSIHIPKHLHFGLGVNLTMTTLNILRKKAINVWQLILLDCKTSQF